MDDASKSMVESYKKLIEDSATRTAIVNDPTCFGALVLLLDCDEQEIFIVNETLKIMLKLADDAPNRPTMKTFIGMMESLDFIINRPNCDRQTSFNAETLQALLTEKNYKPEQYYQHPLKETVNLQRHPGRGKRRSNFFIQNPGKSKTVTLQIKGLNDKRDSDLCKEQLLTVKGVISITFDFSKKRSVVRLRPDIKPELLIQAVARTEMMTAEQVVKDEQGQELFLSFGANPAEMEKENLTIPDYLPSDEEEDENPQAITRSRKSTSQGGWIKTAANFLTSSFYW